MNYIIIDHRHCKTGFPGASFKKRAPLRGAILWKAAALRGAIPWEVVACRGCPAGAQSFRAASGGVGSGGGQWRGGQGPM
ncbi:MAG TPA: hypothetical protein PKG95_10720, partial [Anaerolineaceae bacterium]|nr:hypothetical protein [Anaerolineaceae bacterium]